MDNIEIVEQFMKNVFNTEDYFSQNKPFLKNYLKQEVE